MTDYYVDSVGGNDADGLSWATAFTSVHARQFNFGDYVRIASRHVEAHAGSALSLLFGDSEEGGAIVESVQVGTTTPETMEVGGGTLNSTTTHLQMNDGGRCFGLTFEVASPGNVYLNNTNAENLYFENCMFRIGTGNGHIRKSGAAGQIIMRGCTVEYLGGSGDASSLLYLANSGEWWMFDTTFLNIEYKDQISTLFPGELHIVGSDLSAMGSLGGGAMAATMQAVEGQVNLIGCKLPDTWMVVGAGTYTIRNGLTSVINSDNDTRNGRYISAYGRSIGTVDMVSDVYASAGFEPADAPNPVSLGVSALSSKANSFNPFLMAPISKYNTLTGAVTVTLEILAADAAAITQLTDADVFMLVSYLGDAGSTKLNVGRSGMLAPSDTPQNLPSSGAAWTTTGAASNTQAYSISLPVTIGRAGAVTIQPCIASLNGNDELYINPQVRIS